jgi:hypothetical protein
MKSESAINAIRHILLLIDKYSQAHSQHINNCEFLSAKYVELEQALINNTEALAELIEWNKWFAPRIIYDGIGNKELLNKVEELALVLNKETT